MVSTYFIQTNKIPKVYVYIFQAKHEPICKKSAAKKTKVFDSAKQRAEGTEVSYKQIKQAQKKVCMIYFLSNIFADAHAILVNEDFHMVQSNLY